jgi:hypothetical protein
VPTHVYCNARFIIINGNYKELGNSLPALKMLLCGLEKKVGFVGLGNKLMKILMTWITEVGDCRK